MKQEDKKYILENCGKMSVPDMAKKLGLKEHKVRRFLDEEGADIRRPVPGNAHGRQETSFFTAYQNMPKYAVVILLIIFGFIIYGNSFNNEFVFDDASLVVDNTAIKSFANMRGVFTHDATYFGGIGIETFFRPLQAITYMIDYFLWGDQPLGYHMTNTILHILVSVLFFYLATLIIKDTILSFLAGLLYLAHPVHTQAVAYISGRADPLCAIFVLIMLIFQYKFFKEQKPGLKAARFLSLMIVFLLALMSKELGAISLFLLVFYEYCLSDENRYSNPKAKWAVFYLPLFLLAGAWLAYRGKIITIAALVEDVPTLRSRLIQLPALIFEYLRLSLFPVNLHMEYRIPFPRSILQEEYLWPFLFLLVFIYALYILWKMGRASIHYRRMFFGLGWFVIALLPYMHIISILNAPLAEHWLYIPEMGLILFLVYGAFYFFRNMETAKKVLAVIFLNAIIILSILTVRQNNIWRDGISLYTNIAKYTDSAKIYSYLAREYQKKGDIKTAREYFARSLKINPNYTPALDGLRGLGAEPGR